MKKLINYKRVISFVIMLSIFAGFMPLAETEIQATSSTLDSGVRENSEQTAMIVLDEEIVVYAENNSGIAVFAFEPIESGTYSFYSYDNDFDTYGHLYDSEMNQLAYDDDGYGENNNFKINYELVAGNRYYLKSKPWSSAEATLGEYKVKIVKLVAAEELSILPDTICGYEGDSYYLETKFSPDNCIPENVVWSTSDSSVVKIEQNGYIKFVSAGVAIITITSENGLTDTAAVTVREGAYIVLDEEIVVYAENNSGIAVFAFEPIESGTYSFYSYDNDFDTYGYLYDSEMNQLAYDDGYGENNNFKINYELVAGNRYYLKSRPWSSADATLGEYKVKIVKLVAAEELSILPDTICGYEGDSYYLETKFSPDNCIPENVVWSTSDSSVVKIEQNGYIKFVSAGVAIITITSENGLTDTAAVTVREGAYIVLDEEIVVYAENNSGIAVFAFEPIESGTYSFYSYDNDFDTYGHLYDSEMNQLAYDDDGYGENNNFKINYELVAGNRYYLKSRPWSSAGDTVGEYKVKIVKLVAAEELSILPDTICGYEGDSYFLETKFSPDNCIPENVVWSTSDSSVVKIEQDGYITFVSAGVAIITVTSENGLTDTATVTVRERAYIVLDEEIVVYAENNSGIAVFAFEPIESGTYSFYSYDNDFDTYGLLYDSEMNQLAYDDGGYGENNNFKINYELVAGNRYYLKSRPWSSAGDTVGEYKVKIVKLVAAEELSILPDTICGYVGYSYSLKTEFSPDNSIIEKVTWSSSDSSVVKIEQDGYITFVSAGVAIITVTSENGLTDTATVTVREGDSIGLDEKKQGTIAENVIGSTFMFTPEETGVYSIEISPDYVAESGGGVIMYHRVDISIRDLEGNIINNQSEWADVSLEQQMDGGMTYYISTSYPKETYGNYDIIIKQLPPPGSFEITYEYDDSLEGYVGFYYGLNTEIEPENAYTVGVNWSSSDESIVQVDDRGMVYIKGVGTATVTATTLNGISDSIVVNAMSVPEIVLDEIYTVEMIENRYDKRYKFIPTETDTYSFEFEKGISFSIRNENDNIIYSSYDGMHNYQLIAGETYFLVTYNYEVESYTFKISKATHISSLEITSYPKRMDFYVGYEYFSYYGLGIKAILEDGTVINWSYDSYEDLAGYFVNIDDLYVDGIYKETVITCANKTVSFKFNVKENPVDHLEVILDTSFKYIENYDGYYVDENNDGKYFYYYTKEPNDAVVKIVYKDGTSTTARVGETVENYEISWNENQHNEPWVVGGENKSTITYLGHDVNLPITVEKNWVESIEVVSGKVTCIENAYGYEISNGFLYYYDMPDDVTLKINYLDGSSKVVNIKDKVDGYSFDFYEDQYSKPWVLGEDNYITLSYLGAETQLPVSVIANPVERIEINSAPTREYIYGDIKYGEFDNNSYGLFYPNDLTGLSFTVYYTDGTNKTFSYEDIDEDGKINGYGYYLNRDDSVPTIGDFPMQFEYMGRTAEYTVVLKETNVSSISVTKVPDKNRFDEPNFVGMEIVINYKDGTAKTVVVTDDNLYYVYNYHWGEFYHYISIDDSVLRIVRRGDYWYAVYLGTTCEIRDLSFEESKDINSIELKIDSWIGYGMIADVKYADGTTETLTIEMLDYFFYSYGSTAYCYGKTEDGIIDYAIKVFTDQEGKETRYEVSIFGETISVEAKNVLPGDVTGDGVVNNKDVTLLRRYLIGGWDVTIDSDAADVNKDGDINNKDVTLLRRYLIGGWNVILG